MDGTLLALIIVLAGVAILGAILYGAMGRRGAGEPMTEATAEMVGPQYTTGGNFEAKELYAAVPSTGRVSLQELPAAERQRFAERWLQIQTDFVDEPEGAMSDAGNLARELLVREALRLT